LGEWAIKDFTMLEEAEINFSISQKEYARYFFQIIKRSDKVFYLSLGLFFILIGFIPKPIDFDKVILASNKHNDVTDTGFLLFPILWIIVPVIRYYNVRNSYKKFKGSLMNQKWLLNNDKIRMCRKKYCSIIQWSEVNYIIDTEDFFSLVINKKHLIISKNSMTITEQNLLRSYLSKKPLYASNPLSLPVQKTSPVSYKEIFKIILIIVVVFISFILLMLLALYLMVRFSH
jgi:hypothetical protein